MNDPNKLYQEIRELEKNIKQWKQQLKRIDDSLIQKVLIQNIQSARSESERKLNIIHSWLNRHLNKDEEEQVKDRLRALGYID